MSTQDLIIRLLAKENYLIAWQRMQDFTAIRTVETLDEIWFLEHPPVFTQGQNGKEEHLLNAHDIPVIKTDRGGQITYHGPGQLMVYTLLDIKRKGWGVRELVSRLEQSVIDTLSTYLLDAYADKKAPGVYIKHRKICSIGIRIRRGATFHGLAVNINMDLTPFSFINPCGYPNLKMTMLAHFIPNITIKAFSTHLIDYLKKNLSYTSVRLITS